MELFRFYSKDLCKNGDRPLQLFRTGILSITGDTDCISRILRTEF